LDRLGVGQALARQIIRLRLTYWAHEQINARYARGEKRAVWVEERDKSILTLPEFRSEDRAQFWVIFLETRAPGKPASPTAVKLLDGEESLTRALFGIGVSPLSAIVLNISQIVQRVRLIINKDESNAA
jgi:hypothetical protein